MSRVLDHLFAGLIAAVLTGAIAGVAIWKITATQHDFIARQFAAQNAKIKSVGGEIAKTASDLKRLDGSLKATETTLREVKDQVALVGTRSGIAQLNGKLDTIDKHLATLQATSDDKTRGQALARIETAVAAVKDAIGKRPADSALAEANAKLDDALKSLTALDTAVRQGFADAASKRAELVKAVANPAPAPAPPQAAKPEQDLVVFYVAMAGAAPAPPPPPKGEPGLTPAVPPPFAVRFERLGGVDDEGQTKLIVDKVRALIKGHSACAIAVAGHADTLGGDRRNYELSKRRANEVADKLKSAFAGQSVAVTETQWGERRLAEWTPDGVANEANRRVDISVSCKK